MHMAQVPLITARIRGPWLIGAPQVEKLTNFSLNLSLEVFASL